MSLSVSVIVDPNRLDYIVIAESKGGDPNHVIVVDAHLSTRSSARAAILPTSRYRSPGSIFLCASSTRIELVQI